MPKQKHLTLSKLLHLKGYAKQNHTITGNTATAKYAIDVFNNIDNPKLKDYDVILYTLKRRKEIQDLCNKGDDSDDK